MNIQVFRARMQQSAPANAVEQELVLARGEDHGQTRVAQGVEVASARRSIHVDHAMALGVQSPRPTAGNLHLGPGPPIAKLASLDDCVRVRFDASSRDSEPWRDRKCALA